MAIELLSPENIEQLLTAKQRSVLEYLNQTNEASPSEISQKTDIAQPTVRQALAKLLRLKRVKRLGQGRSTVYKRII